MEWIKLSSKGILRGSLAQTTDVIQLVWIKLLCLMSETKFRNGRFEYASSKPYTLDFIAVNCGVSVTILEGCLCEYEEDVNPEDGSPRIKYDDDGTLILVNWEKYQSKPEKVIAKEIAIEKAKSTKRTTEAVAVSSMRAVNKLAKTTEALNKKLKVIPIADGQTLDTETGEIKGGNNADATD